MLIRGLRRPIPLVAALLLVAFLAVRFYGRWPWTWTWTWTETETQEHALFPVDTSDAQESVPAIAIPPGTEDSSNFNSDTPALLDENVSDKYRVIFSASTADMKYFPISFGDRQALNPSIIPHPSLPETWIIVAQQRQTAMDNSIWSAELVCNAVFEKDGTLACVDPATVLPIAGTPSSPDKCVGELAPLALNIGPHDARVFYGPKSPYTVYGSNSGFTCFGQWMLGFRTLTDWKDVDGGTDMFATNDFSTPTELQRPWLTAWGAVEKNWFVFWDTDEQVYVHHDIAPKRMFAKLEADGSVGLDLATDISPHESENVNDNDSACMARYMPTLADPQFESIHQATNSLSITLCTRSDPTCTPAPSNTFILTIFQHKSFYGFHSNYDPHVLLFRQTHPFAVYGISTKPLWIHGRRPGQMFYVTSVSWKRSANRYHGYVDDVLFLGFGIEDEKTAGMDVVAGDLLVDLGLCSSLHGGT